MIGTVAAVTASWPLASGIQAVTLLAPEVARLAEPGQFLMVEGGPGRTTRRPFSLYDVEPAVGLVHLAVRASGPASNWLASRRPGSTVALHGPLGKGFGLPAAGTEGAWVVGGGMGAAPLVFLTATLSARGFAVWAALGGRSAEEVWAAGRLRALGAEVEVATEDGTLGQRGLVTDLVAEKLCTTPRRPAAVYACGPRGMLAAVAAQVLGAGLPCQVSVEERMACGVGACAGCTWPDGRLGPGLDLRPLGDLPGTLGEGEGGHPLRVCRDGPCFEVVRA